MATIPADSLPAGSGFSTSWDWKSTFVDNLAEDSLDRFAQYSATPDTTALFAGPARFAGVGSDPTKLLPIGLVDNISMQSNPNLARLYEIGSNRAFFTRGKTFNSIQLSKMLADQANILNALAKNATRPTAINASGTASPGAEAPNPAIMMNLDSEYFDVPFGMLLLFKTRGGGDSFGKILSAIYLESCFFSNYAFQVANASPVILEQVAIEYDRPVPVSFN